MGFVGYGGNQDKQDEEQQSTHTCNQKCLSHQTPANESMTPRQDPKLFKVPLERPQIPGHRNDGPVDLSRTFKATGRGAWSFGGTKERRAEDTLADAQLRRSAKINDTDALLRQSTGPKPSDTEQYCCKQPRCSDEQAPFTVTGDHRNLGVIENIWQGFGIGGGVRGLDGAKDENESNMSPRQSQSDISFAKKAFGRAIGHLKKDNSQSNSTADIASGSQSESTNRSSYSTPSSSGSWDDDNTADRDCRFK